MLVNPERSTGIYVHVPFCLSKCRYCDFYSISQLDVMADYAMAVLQEMDIAGINFPPADTLYFGGGTPSLLPSDQIARIIDHGASLFDLTAYAEITMEANPATLTMADLKSLKTSGVNRLNIGIQSFQQEHLSFLGRIHTPGQAIACVDAARLAGFDNLGIDLIYGLPGQSPDGWSKDLNLALDLDPEHLSCYILSYEPGTPLYNALKSGAVDKLADDPIADLFHQTHDTLSAAGYEHYEISNFAKTGYHSRHNRKYWTGDPYLGLGPAAHSYRNPARWWNHRSIERYLELLSQGCRAVDSHEILTGEQQMIEILYLGLRQADGFDLCAFRRNLPSSAKDGFDASLDRWQQGGYLVSDRCRCRPTVSGMLLLDHIAAELAAQL